MAHVGQDQKHVPSRRCRADGSSCHRTPSYTGSDDGPAEPSAALGSGGPPGPACGDDGVMSSNRRSLTTADLNVSRLS